MSWILEYKKIYNWRWNWGFSETCSWVLVDGKAQFGHYNWKLMKGYTSCYTCPPCWLSSPFSLSDVDVWSITFTAAGSVTPHWNSLNLYEEDLKHVDARWENYLCGTQLITVSAVWGNIFMCISHIYVDIGKWHFRVSCISGITCWAAVVDESGVNSASAVLPVWAAKQFQSIISKKRGGGGVQLNMFIITQLLVLTMKQSIFSVLIKSPLYIRDCVISPEWRPFSTPA